LNKGELVLQLDELHTPLADKLFLGLTSLGELFGGALVLLCIIVFAKRRYIAIFLAAASLSMVTSQGLKHLVFQNEGRPSSVYEDLAPVKNLKRHQNNSFPSGHTTGAFTFFTVLALGLKKKWIQVLAPTLAALVGISRVYLGQHFLSDIVAGAVIGLFVASITVLLFNKLLPPKEYVAES